MSNPGAQPAKLAEGLAHSTLAYQPLELGYASPTIPQMTSPQEEGAKPPPAGLALIYTLTRLSTTAAATLHAAVSNGCPMRSTTHKVPPRLHFSHGLLKNWQSICPVKCASLGV